MLALAAPLMGVRRPKLRDLPLIALCGLAGMTGYQLLLNAGERVVPAGTASLLVATAPVYASLLAVAFLGERSTAMRWAGSAVALAGTAQKPLLARYTGFEVTAYAMWAGTVFILPWTGSLVRALPQAGGAAIGSAVFLGVAPSAAGFVLWAYAMARMDVGRRVSRTPAAARAAPGQAAGRAATSPGRAGSSPDGPYGMILRHGTLPTWRYKQLTEPGRSSPARVRGSGGRWPAGWPRRARGWWSTT